MLYVIILFAFLSGILLSLKIERNSLIALKYKHKIFALRDKLRRALIDGKIRGDNWFFNYLDSSLSKVVLTLEILSVYQVAYINLKHRNSSETALVKKKINQAVSQNAALNEIYEEYGQIILEFFAERHITTVRLVGSAARFVSGLLNLKNMVQKNVLEIRNLPETSDYSFVL